MVHWARARVLVTAGLATAAVTFFTTGAALAAPDAPPPAKTTPTATAQPAKPTPTATAQPAKEAAKPSVGYDISYPQCGRVLPAGASFAVVGVNGGLAYSANPCLATEYTWALGSTSTTQARASFYLNTGNPGPVVSTHWPPANTTAPLPCDGSWSAACAYDYGWLAARDSFSRAAAPQVAGQAAAVAAPWWLDVETANSWSTDRTTNLADLRGAVAYLKSVGVSRIGIYASTGDWAQITGATSPDSAINDPFRTLLNWVPGASSAKAAPGFCSRTFTGGKVELVQYPTGGFDGDYDCTP